MSLFNLKILSIGILCLLVPPLSEAAPKDLTSMVPASPQSTPHTMASTPTTAPEKTKIMDVGMVTTTPVAPLSLDGAGQSAALKDLGLKATAWGDLSRHKIVSLFEQLPTSYLSSVLKDIARQFLLAPLKVPHTDNPLDTQNLLLIRADKLFSMGYSSDAFALLKEQRTLHLKPLFLKLQFEQAIMRQDLKTACPLAHAQLKHGPSPYWEKAVVVCQILSGKYEEARLSLEVIGESRYEEDKDFITAAQLILEPAFTDQLPPLTQPDMLSIILLNAAPKGLTEDIVVKLPTATRAQISTFLTPLNTTPEIRLQLIEENAQAGLSEGRELKEAYQSYIAANPEFVKSLDTKDITDLRGQNAPKVRAYLFSKALYGATSEMRVDAISTLLKNAETFHMHRAASSALGKTLEEIQPDRGAASLADEVLSTFILSNRPESTCTWRHYISNANAPSTVPLLLLGCHSLDPSIQHHLLTEWLEFLKKNTGGKQGALKQYVEAVFSILEAMGLQIQESLWQTIGARPATEATRLSLSQQALIRKAIKGHKPAEALCYLLTSFSDNAALWTLENLLYVLKTLQEIGLKKQSLHLATQMLLTLPLEAPDAAP